MDHSKRLRVKPRHTAKPGPAELCNDHGIQEGAWTHQARPGSAVFLLCSQPLRVAAILRRLSSSLLPPSFAAGRCTTAFTAARGTPRRFVA